MYADLEERGATPGDGVVGWEGAHTLGIIELEAHVDQAAIVVLQSTRVSVRMHFMACIWVRVFPGEGSAVNDEEAWTLFTSHTQPPLKNTALSVLVPAHFCRVDM